ncbi:unnamed protein product [Caenorhabditis bovis]|uniref:C2H2-type domain-containing protein n=1 Tax=Caenorhabditis bovis TaxID=2654633 RepID=A0A8S1EMU7_9PELO|nr:unnamed protein product [Caenorhabditis bovis]
MEFSQTATINQLPENVKDIPEKTCYYLTPPFQGIYSNLNAPSLLQTGYEAFQNPQSNGHGFQEAVVNPTPNENSFDKFSVLDNLEDPRIQCKRCNRTYKNLTTLNAHLRNRHERSEAICQEANCNFVTLTVYDRKRHQKMHAKQRAKFFEEMCNKRGQPEQMQPIPHTTHEYMRSEIFKVQKDVPGMIKGLDDRDRVTYTCVDCQKIFINSHQALMHREKHENSPIACYYCGDIRHGALDLRNHYIRKHKNDGINTYICQGCQK